MKARILFTIPNFDTAGSGKALLNLAQGLDKNKFEPRIACLNEKGNLFKIVKESGIPVHVFDFITPRRPFMRLFIRTWLVSRKLKKIKPDIIHSFNYDADYTEAAAARMAGIPWIFSKKNMNWGGGSARAWKLRSSLASGIIILNSDMQGKFYPDRKNVHLIPRGVDITKFVAHFPNMELKSEMGTPADTRVIICVANFAPVKGIEILLEAFKVLSPEFPDWNLWLVGDNANEYGEKITSWVKGNGMDERIRFSGKRGDIRPYLDIAEIFVLPTLGKGEGSPVALLEAMSAGKVVIGSSVPGITDQLKEYPKHLFEPGNSKSLACRLSAFMKSSIQENISLGKSFSKHVKENFSLEKEIREHEIFYQKILQN
jgi:glycosyltransferase involved in cell wall biosynthesis